VNLRGPTIPAPVHPPGPPTRFRAVAAAVLAYAVAMAFLESAVVVYLQRALGIDPRALFPLQNPVVTGDLATIEVGREAATLVMLGTVGWLAGRSGLERLAWTAVAFGTWDIFYYAWLWAFIGWPVQGTGMRNSKSHVPSEDWPGHGVSVVAGPCEPTGRRSARASWVASWSS